MWRNRPAVSSTSSGANRLLDGHSRSKQPENWSDIVPKELDGRIAKSSTSHCASSPAIFFIFLSFGYTSLCSTEITGRVVGSSSRDTPASKAVGCHYGSKHSERR